ncbi:MAG: hypothetical protein ACXWLH_02790 [Candidatus Saccharimonadales bacterium]
MKIFGKTKRLNQFGHAHLIVPALVVLIVAVVGVKVLTRSHALTASEPAHGLIIQVSTLAPNTTPATLKTWLDDIRRDHRVSGQPGYINNVTLQDIADKNGNLLTSYLDVIAPYLPGGATPAFTKAYIGTVDLPWTQAGSKYIDGIENADFRNSNVLYSAKAAADFKARYPKVALNWYITYEANLAGFWDASIEQAYSTYITQLISVLNKVAVNKTFMWSPAFWTPYRNEPSWALSGLQMNLSDLFSKINQSFIVDLQDFVGQSSGATTKEDAVAWAKYLKQNWSSKAAIQVNAEQFKLAGDGSLIAADSSEILTRENYYKSKSLALGPAWEIRFWHKRLYGN